MDNSNNSEMIGFIASTVERIDDRVNLIQERMATKEQLDAATTAIRGDVEQVPAAEFDGTLDIISI